MSLALFLTAAVWIASTHQQLLEDLDLLTGAEQLVVFGRATSIRPFGGPGLLAVLLIRLYQRFISTQDLDVCNFVPSCSNFALQAITGYGLIKGLLLTADRLLRCHGLTYRYWPEYYPRDGRTGKLIDPVERYR